ncbi:MAG TPA: hypothetical protein VMY88_12925 [Acidimicrobiales bacterium]|nr:hypothetical protein [Acidimicrobiales bacterium]
MTRRLDQLALVLLVAVFATGCGGGETDDSSTAEGMPAVTTTVADDTPTDETTTEEGTPTVGDTDVPGNTEQGIQACKDSIDENPNVSDDIKDDLKSICDKVGGDPEEIREAAREVCEKIVESSVPAGDTRDQAREACANAGG